jgi:uncharacterized protein YraI
MRHTTLPILFALMFVAGCTAVGGSQTVVKGAGADEFLKLRAGPGLGYRVVLGLPDGTALTRGTCVTEVGQLWCKVALVGAPGINGYVSADYLTAR